MISDFGKAKALTITYLTPVSFASLNGGDKEADNIVSIKKLTRETESGTREYPYVSSQAIRRALRDQLKTLGHELSEAVVASEKKGAATTKCDPEAYIDDDLFGYMDAKAGEEGKKGKTKKRTSPVRVAPLTAFSPYYGDLDFGTNYMSARAGGDPNIFETEIHSGLYRGTVLIELDRVGSDEGFEKPLIPEQKAQRVIALLSALQNLWSSGRQSRFLADLTPKFVAGAITTAKVPIFLESVQLQGGHINGGTLKEILADHQSIILDHIFGARSGLFDGLLEETVTVGAAFQKMAGWVSSHFSAGA